jgi:hypothetical protein
MRRKLIALLTVGALASFVSMTKAATVTLYLTTINATNTGGTYALYIADSTDNDGLANFDVDVVGNNGAVVNSVPTLKAPRINDISGQYADAAGGNMGFNTSDSTGANNGTGRSGIVAGQDTVYGASDDPTYDMGIFVGVGQEAGAASPQNGTQGPTDGSGTPTGTSAAPWLYTVPGTMVAGGNGVSYAIGGTIVEQGTYTVPGGITGVNPLASLSVNVDGFVEVLGTGDNGNNEAWTLANQQGNTPAAAILPNGDNLADINTAGDTISLAVPEPTSIGLIAIGMGMAATGRKMRRKTA